MTAHLRMGNGAQKGYSVRDANPLRQLPGDLEPFAIARHNELNIGKPWIGFERALESLHRGDQAFASKHITEPKNPHRAFPPGSVGVVREAVERNGRLANKLRSEPEPCHSIRCLLVRQKNNRGSVDGTAYNRIISGRGLQHSPHTLFPPALSVDFCKRPGGDLPAADRAPNESCSGHKPQKSWNIDIIVGYVMDQRKRMPRL